MAVNFIMSLELPSTNLVAKVLVGPDDNTQKMKNHISNTGAVTLVTVHASNYVVY